MIVTMLTVFKRKDQVHRALHRLYEKVNTEPSLIEKNEHNTTPSNSHVRFRLVPGSVTHIR